MITYLCVTPQREEKTKLLMQHIHHGMPNSKILVGAPPHDMKPFMIWGQVWLTLDVLPRAIREGRAFWHIDNGYVHPAKGFPTGYYRFTYKSMTPVVLTDPNLRRIRQLDAKLHPWKKNGSYILIALPGLHFGFAMGMSMQAWIRDIRTRVKAVTNRPIRVREKGCPRPLADDLAGAWALVTHSSNVAVDAVLAGVPVFVEPTSPAAPMGRTDFEFEFPVYPEREPWLASLLMQQFTLAEMHNGYAYQMMKKVEACHV